MVGRPGKYQPRFTAGELDALIQGNTDEAVYFKGAAAMINAKPSPQGGFGNMWRTVGLGRSRNMLQALAIVSASAPAGVAANATDGVIGTYLKSAALAAPTVVLTVDLGGVHPVSCVDLENFAGVPAGGAAPTIAQPSPPLIPPIGGSIEVDTSPDNATWSPLDNVLGMDAALRTRRFAALAGAPVQARYIRVIANVTPAGSAFWLDNIRVWEETATLSPMRIRSFTHSRSAAYDLVFTDQNAEVYAISGRVASIPTTLTGPTLAGPNVPAMKNAQQLDTMLMFHQQLQPLRFLRQGSDFEWNADPTPFENIPNWDYGAGYSNGVAAEWQLSFFNFDTGTGTFPLPSGGAHYTISVNGVASAAIQQPPGSYGGTAAAIQAAILGLPGVAPGVTVVNTSASPPTFLVTFGGAGNVGDGWAVAGVAVDKGDAAITAAHIVAGVVGGEPLMSAARGWPSCGCFYGQRTVMAGFAGVPNAFLASESGDFFELNTALVAASAPMLVPLDTLGAATIVDVHNGRTLDFFTDAGEYWLSTGALDRTVTPIIILGTTNGIAPTVDAFENEGKTYYVGREGGSLFEFVFNYSEQNYDSNNISTDSSSIVKGLIDASMRRVAASTDLNELYCVRSDGVGILLNLLRQQDITGFARITTDGQFLCVNVNDRFEVTWGVARQVAAQTVQFIERMVEGNVLDAQQTVAVVAGAATIAGLTNQEGATVYAIVDGFVQGPFTVVGGVITLGFPVEANGEALVGRWTPPYIATLPQPRDVAPRTVVRRPCRVHTVRLSVVDTSNIAIGANGDGPYDAPLNVYGGLTDIPPMSAPYTGPVVQEGLQGYTEDGTVVITQTRPGLFNVTGVTVEVDL